MDAKGSRRSGAGHRGLEQSGGSRVTAFTSKAGGQAQQISWATGEEGAEHARCCHLLLATGAGA